jgi:hypothetical protein
MQTEEKRRLILMQTDRFKDKFTFGASPDKSAFGAR